MRHNQETGQAINYCFLYNSRTAVRPTLETLFRLMLLNKFVILHTIRKVFQQGSITPFVDRHLLTHIVSHIVCGGVLMRLGFLQLFILRIRPSRSEDNKQDDGRNSERQTLKVGKQLERLFIPHTQTFIRRKHYRIKETA